MTAYLSIKDWVDSFRECLQYGYSHDEAMQQLKEVYEHHKEVTSAV